MLAIFLFFSVLPIAEGQGTPPVSIYGGSDAVVGLYIEDLSDGNVIVKSNSEKSMIPASIMKALTSATALSIFDPEGTFRTPVTTTGAIRNGVIEGDIVISTIGDPTVESRHFPSKLGFADSVVKHLKRLNVTEIKGSVVIDEKGFKDESTPQGWLDEDITALYGAGLYASNFRDNHVVLKLPSKETVPVTPALKINVNPSKERLKVSRKRDTKVYEITGRIPSKGFASKYTNPAPGSAMRAEVLDRIRSAGIKIGDEASGIKKGTRDLYVHHSPRVMDVLRSLMFRSDNMMAEGMLRSTLPGRTRDDAARCELEMWRGRGLDTDGVTVKDGSGLSRMDRMTPKFMAELLKWMACSDMRDEYISLFPRAGMEGTMRRFLKGTPLEGRIAMKTGSMRGVQCFAGYKLDDNDKPTHVVVIMVNNFSVGRDKLRREISDMLLSTFDIDWVAFGQ